MRKLLLLCAAFVMMGGVLFADVGERKDLQVFNDISRTVNDYTQFTVFDDVDAVVKEGIVTLTGAVTMPHKRVDIEKRVAKIDGVVEVRNQINVLPASLSDDRLRYNDCPLHLRQSPLLELRHRPESADPHHRRPRARHAHGRCEQRDGPDDRAVAGASVPRDVGDEQPQDKR